MGEIAESLFEFGLSLTEYTTLPMMLLVILVLLGYLGKKIIKMFM